MAWDRMVPVGREFGSLDFECLMERGPPKGGRRIRSQCSAPPKTPQLNRVSLAAICSANLDEGAMSVFTKEEVVEAILLANRARKLAAPVSPGPLWARLQ